MRSTRSRERTRAVSVGCVEMGISRSGDGCSEIGEPCRPCFGELGPAGMAAGSCGEFLVRARVEKSVLVSAGWPGTCVGMW